jgi:hypothetical protein
VGVPYRWSIYVPKLVVLHGCILVLSRLNIGNRPTRFGPASNTIFENMVPRHKRTIFLRSYEVFTYQIDWVPSTDAFVPRYHVSKKSMSKAGFKRVCSIRDTPSNGRCYKLFC